MSNFTTPEERIKQLEIEVSYLIKEITKLVTVIEQLKPEIHYHFTNIYSSKDNLNNFDNFGE